MFNTSRTRTTSFPSPLGGSNTLSAAAYDPLASSAYMEEEPDPWSGAPTPSRTPGLAAGGGAAANAISSGLAGMGGGALGRLMNGLNMGGPNGVAAPLVIGMSKRLGCETRETYPDERMCIGRTAEKDVPRQYQTYVESLDTDGSGYISLTAVHRLLSSSGLSATVVEQIISSVVNPSEPSVTKQQAFVVFGLAGLAQNGQVTKAQSSISSLPSPPINATEPYGAKSMYAPRPVRGYSTTSSNGFGSASTPNINAAGSSSSAAAAYAGSPWGTPGATQRAGLPRMNSDLADPMLVTTPGALQRSDSILGYDTPALNEYSQGNILEEGEEHEEVEDVDADKGLSAENMKGWWKELETVQVSLLPDKEGWFLQKYKVESDPFRLLPTLPPKRIGPDHAFLEQRRKGLKRFINFVANHPILKDDGAVNVFLTQSGPFEAWRKKNRVNLDEESTQKKLDKAAEMRIPSDLDTKLDLLRSSLPILVESYSKLVMIAEKAVKRMEAAAADQARMAMTLATLGEKQPMSCWRCANPETANGIGGNACNLCKGVSRGLAAVGDTFTKEAEDSDRRAKDTALGTIEMLKQERDVFVAFSQLFLRHDKLSKDTVDTLRKRVEAKQKKLSAVRQAKKSSWETEAEKLVTAIEQDNNNIKVLLERRVFIRHCMYHEMLVLHSRQTGQATLLARQYAKDRAGASEHAQRSWLDLGRRLKDMPVD
ncbi:hypothetical protein QFC21_001440 [Naganishia friedmannii]|uniref:Uncharacterized protein n=1 Tax=Naganishia friedmannii TaxID=89922 RepID=A0ACC2W4Q0_9TREE|nr:hypothetical protein QFC21_001440 [Naganishia friedmannii]